MKVTGDGIVVTLPQSRNQPGGSSISSCGVQLGSCEDKEDVQWQREVNTKSQQHTYSHSARKVGIDYLVRIRVQNKIGWSPYSATTRILAHAIAKGKPSGWSSGWRWDPSKKPTNITIESDGITCRQTSNNWATVACKRILRSGRHEFTVKLLSGSNMMVGFADPAQGYDNQLGGGNVSRGYGYYNSGGHMYHNNTTSNAQAGTTGSNQGYKIGDVIKAVLDLKAGIITYFKNGSQQAHKFSGVKGPLCAAVSLYTSAAQIVQ